MLLEKNQLEEEIAGTINFDTSLWLPAIERLRRYYGDVSFGWGHLSGLLAEALVRESVERICGSMDGRVKFDPIPNRAKSLNYEFKCDKGILEIIRRTDGQLTSDVDLLMLIDELPVLFEVKSGVYKGGGSRKNKTKSSLGTFFALKRERVMEVIEPIKEYFRTDCGFVLVVPSDHVIPYSPTQIRFLSENGVMTDFGLSRDKYQLETLPNIVARYGIRTKGGPLRLSHR